MSGYATLRVHALGLDSAHKDTGSTRRQYGRRREDRIHVREYFDLKRLAFGGVFLHHVRARKGFFEIRFESQTRGRRSRCQSDLCQRGHTAST